MPNEDEAAGPAAGRFQRLTQAQELTETTAQKLLSVLERSEPVKRIRASQALSAILGTLGFALFLLGVERVTEDLPVVSNGWGAIGVGILLLAATGLLLQKMIKGD